MIPEPLTKENFRKHKAIAEYLPQEEWVRVKDVECAVAWRNSLKYVHNCGEFITCIGCNKKVETVYYSDRGGIASNIGCSSCATKKAFGVEEEKIK